MRWICRCNLLFFADVDAICCTFGSLEQFRHTPWQDLDMRPAHRSRARPPLGCCSKLLECPPLTLARKPKAFFFRAVNHCGLLLACGGYCYVFVFLFVCLFTVVMFCCFLLCFVTVCSVLCIEVCGCFFLSPSDKPLGSNVPWRFRKHSLNLEVKPLDFNCSEQAFCLFLPASGCHVHFGRLFIFGLRRFRSPRATQSGLASAAI